MAGSDTTARGLLMLRLIPTSCTDVVLVTLDTTDMDSDTTDTDSDTMADSDTTDTDSDTMADSDTTARGLLMLSLRPRLILTTLDTVLDTPD